MSDTMIPTRVLGRQGLIVSAWALGAWACHSPTGQQTNRRPSPQSIQALYGLLCVRLCGTRCAGPRRVRILRGK